jgi:hypothetical protein
VQRTGPSAAVCLKSDCGTVLRVGKRNAAEWARPYSSSRGAFYTFPCPSQPLALRPTIWICAPFRRSYIGTGRGLPESTFSVSAGWWAVVGTREHARTDGNRIALIGAIGIPGGAVGGASDGVHHLATTTTQATGALIGIARGLDIGTLRAVRVVGAVSAVDRGCRPTSRGRPARPALVTTRAAAGRDRVAARACLADRAACGSGPSHPPAPCNASCAIWRYQSAIRRIPLTKTRLIAAGHPDQAPDDGHRPNEQVSAHRIHAHHRLHTLCQQSRAAIGLRSPCNRLIFHSMNPQNSEGSSPRAPGRRCLRA